eukprot:m.604891 g.604891  ORF g.604891 m.604891 type:complete len:95 (+) comp22462_c0_seq20:3186-3470(+)
MENCYIKTLFLNSPAGVRFAQQQHRAGVSSLQGTTISSSEGMGHLGLEAVWCAGGKPKAMHANVSLLLSFVNVHECWVVIGTQQAMHYNPWCFC